MNKIISTSDRLFMAVCGPSCCGKTELIFKMLLVGTFFPRISNNLLFLSARSAQIPIVREETEHTF